MKRPVPAAKGLHDAICGTQLLLVTSLTFQFSSKGNMLTLMSILTDRSSWSLESCVVQHFTTLSSPAIPSSALLALVLFSVFFYLGHHLFLAAVGSCKQSLPFRASTPLPLFLEGTIPPREANLPSFRPHRVLGVPVTPCLVSDMFIT